MGLWGLQVGRAAQRKLKKALWVFTLMRRLKNTISFCIQAMLSTKYGKLTEWVMHRACGGHRAPVVHAEASVGWKVLELSGSSYQV